jgi:hypothetical protein
MSVINCKVKGISFILPKSGSTISISWDLIYGDDDYYYGGGKTGDDDDDSDKNESNINNKDPSLLKAVMCLQALLNVCVCVCVCFVHAMQDPAVCPTRRWIIQIKFHSFIDQPSHSLAEAISPFIYHGYIYWLYCYTLLHAA